MDEMVPKTAEVRTLPLDEDGDGEEWWWLRFYNYLWKYSNRIIFIKRTNSKRFI
jgi:hypothetical protein